LLPLLDDIRSKIEAAQSVSLPSSALSKACQYALTLWRKLTRFLEYPELELSNNLAENSMRSVALGWKNWIHIGSPQAGPKVANSASSGRGFFGRCETRVSGGTGEETWPSLTPFAFGQA
jgi:hypothetical protein